MDTITVKKHNDRKPRTEKTQKIKDEHNENIEINNIKAIQKIKKHQKQALAQQWLHLLPNSHHHHLMILTQKWNDQDQTPSSLNIHILTMSII